MAGNIVVHILGDTTGLGRAIRETQKHVMLLHSSMTYLSRSASMAAMAIAGIGAAGMGAGLIAGGILVGGAAAAAGAMMLLANQAPAVSDAFDAMKDKMKTLSAELTKPMHGPMIAFYDKLTSIFENNLGPSITRISEQMGPFLDKLGSSLSVVGDSLGSLFETMFTSGQGAFLAFIDGLNPVLKGLEEMFKVLEDPAITEFIDTFMVSLGQLLPALGELLVALAPVGTEFLKVLTPALLELTNLMVDHLVPVMLEITKWLQENPGFITALAVAWLGFKAALMATNLVMGATKLAQLALAGLRVVYVVATGAMTVAQWALNASLMGFPLLWIIAAVIAVIAIIWLIVKNWDTITQWLATAWQWIKDKAVEIWDAIKQFFIDTFNNIKAWVLNKVTEMKIRMIMLWNEIKREAITAFVNLVQGIREKMQNAKQWVMDKLNDIISWVKGLPSRFKQAAIDMVQGMINGFMDMAGALKRKAEDIARGALDAIKGFFGINSPSRVMKQMGIYVGQGFIQGLKKEEDPVARAAKALGDAALSNIATSMDGVKGLMSNNKVVVRAEGSLETGLASRNGSMGNIYLTVEAGVGDPEEIGRTVVKYIGAHERVSGTRWRN